MGSLKASKRSVLKKSPTYRKEMAIRVVYPSFQCVRSRPYWSFDDEDVASWLLSPRIRRVNPLAELEQILADSIRRRETASKKSDQKTAEKQSNEPFAVTFQLDGFEPEKIKVKTVGQKLVVEAESEENNETDGYKSYSRQSYHRSIILPENVRPEDVTPVLSDKGVLRITAPVLSLPAPKEEEKKIEVKKEEKSSEDVATDSEEKTDSSVAKDEAKENDAEE